ncbi:polysaccharide deacetylase family protein [Arthrobacter sp. CG_A4]|uniref:polysaccharide deacetylase family protein n=1 Tax=Arthrobacter sp. CG_A4 TaxID=3071706 RepID=UPI002DF872EC|nr:peptidoglycan/xylan/chitin deacetylase (PgdA/CDA1 family) [Arthrobacter sp. CG_A4]
MCEDHPPALPSNPGRRAALGILGASLVAALGACAAPDGTSAGPAAASGVASWTGRALPSALAAGHRKAELSTVSAAPAALRRPGSKRLRRSFIPDFKLPPAQDGLAPVVTKIDTQHPVVFLTIDDGETRTPEMVRLMTEYDYPASIFLARTFVQSDPAFFKQFEAQGSLVENHTVSHNINMVNQLDYGHQFAEIIGMQDYAQQQYGRRPTLFRPPGGAYSNIMRQAAASAGMRAIITWEAKANAGRMDYQHGKVLRPGDIVLMHFRPEFAADLAAFRAAQLAAGLEVVLLEDFLGAV